VAGVLVTGAAGFLGMHVAGALLARGETVYGIDDLGPCLDPALKRARVAELERRHPASFRFARADVAKRTTADDLAREIGPELTGVVHLAARRGTGPPGRLLCRRLAAQLAVLELCREGRLPNLRHAVYACAEPPLAGEKELPPAAGRADEVVALAYARLHGLPLTGLRLATAYGPWDRPDAELVVLADTIAAGRPVSLAGRGREPRRLVYAEDAASAVLAALDRPPPVGESRGPPHRIVPVEYAGSVELGRLVAALGAALGQEPVIRTAREYSVGSQAPEAVGEPDAVTSETEGRPGTPLEEGLRQFAAWYAGRGVAK
jgi:UDP-glucuronate 4-epimerase